MKKIFFKNEKFKIEYLSKLKRRRDMRSDDNLKKNEKCLI